MKYNKLVRDNIPKIIKKRGSTVKTHIADDWEYWEKLKEKLAEEVEEFRKKESEEELADVLEVVDAICEFKKISWEQLNNLREQKAKQRGRFGRRIILDETK